MSPPMPRSRRACNAIWVSFLAALLYAFFQGSKQFAPLSRVNPFSIDPYDAIGSFGFQAAFLLAGLSLLRSMTIKPAPSGEAELLLARTQIASVLAVAITLVADIVAMVRHPDFWSGTAPGRLLAGLVICLILVTAMVGLRVYRYGRRLGVPLAVGARQRALVVCLAALLVLAVYPETSTRGRFGALLAIAVGTVLLFLPIRMLVVAILPGSRTHGGSDRSRLVSGWSVAVVAFAVLAGLLAALGQSTEGGGGPHLFTNGRLAPVVLVFVGFEGAAILTAYALLAKPLGLRQVLSHTESPF